MSVYQHVRMPLSEKQQVMDNISDKNQPRKIIVCSNGNSFMSTRSFTPNTSSFMYANKCQLTTMDVLERQLKCKLTMVRR